ncbi:cholesterol 7-desaturase nvd [Athalia rosae]|uniref:cholesterol 7-desaturase nvd n=1 Tax=Athalia rosae TaxID=37344 RepID=UPI0020344950|nr:cholesterol 7-desaturase nvd [Athalia rosae]
MIVGCWTVSAVTFVLFLIYLAFFWKINWIKDLRDEDTKTSWLFGRLINGGSKSPKNRNRKIGRLPPVYPNGWFVLLESSELKCGQVKHIAALGQNFAVFRTQKGTISVLDAYCPHLGANMGEGGRVRGDCLECPFHGWLFDGTDGRCKKIPYSDKVPEFAKTKAWDCCEINYLIFVWHHAEGMKPDWRPQPIDNIINGNWRYHGRNEFLVNSHIQEIPENGADWAHLSAVHGPLVIFSEKMPWLARHSWTGAKWAPCSRLPRKQKIVPSAEESDTFEEAREEETETMERQEEVETEKNSYDEGGENMREGNSHLASSRLHHNLILMERMATLELDVRADQIGPGYVELVLQTSLGPICILQTVTPLEPLLQRVTHLMFVPPLIAPLATLIFIGECIMFERDVAVWNHKRFEQRPLLVREDRSILAYRRWYSQFYSPHSPTYQSATKSLQW